MKIRDLISDEDFNGLPEIEKAKVVETLAKGDNEFQALPEEEKIKVLATVTGGSYQLASQRGKVQKPQPIVEKEQSFTNLLRQGLPESLSFWGGVAGAYGEIAPQQYRGMEAFGIPTPKAKPEVGKAFTEGAEQGRALGESITKPYKTAPPKDISGKVYESAIKALGDPASWLGGSVGKILSNVLGSSIVSGTAEVTGELGGQAEKALTGKDTGVGRVVGALSAAPTQAATGAIASKGIASPAQELWKKYSGIGKTAGDMEKSLSTGAAQRLLKKAAQEQGIDDIDSFVADFNAIGQKINKQNVPLFVALADNPAIRSQFIYNMKTDDAFRAQVNQQLNTLATDIDRNADKVFGTRFSAVPQGKQFVNIAPIKKRIADVDKKIEELTYKVTPTSSQEDLGSAVTNLVEAKKQLVIKELSPQYEAIKNEAREAGASLSPNDSKVISEFITQNNLRDIFGKGTALDNKIQSVLKQNKGLSFDDIDSLKRNINALQRQNLSQEQLRKVNQLEEVVNTSRGNIPGDFNQRLIDLDKQYYEKLGVPFNTANINDIDAKKYAEQVAPTIIKNGSGLKQFVSAVGDEGLPIARNAVIADVYSKYVKDGKVNLKGLASYVKNKSDVIDQIPGMKQELQMLSYDQNRLMIEKANLDEAYKTQEAKLANSFLKGQEEAPDFTSIANNMVSNRVYLNKVIDKDLKMVTPEMSKAVINNIRRELVNKAYDSGEGVKFFTNPKNKYLVDKVFGTSYANHVKNVSRVADNIATLDVDNIPAVFGKDELDAVGAYARELGLPGLDLPYISSTIRDRISSTTQKAVRLFSRVNTANVNQATKAQIQELLLDPDGLAKFNKVAQEVGFKVDNPVKLRKIVEAFGERLPLYTYQAGKTIDDEEEQPLPEDFVGGEFY